MKRWILYAAAAALLVATGLVLRPWVVREAFAPTKTQVTPGVQKTPEVLSPKEEAEVQVAAENLEIPWALVWLPDGTMLVTQRPGTVLAISPNGNKQAITLPEGAAHTGEAGLLGITLHPNFTANNFIYFYRTQATGDGLINRVERFRLNGLTLSGQTILLDRIPGAPFHDGGALKFGPDGKLYITTGDAGQEQLAQDQASLAGKILRLNDDGSVPADNPFGTPVYSYGHRNPQGLAWDEAGRLWATEHGRSGAQSGLDEINLIEPGGNYGWPLIEGDEQGEGLRGPVIHSGPNDTWAPAGLTFIGTEDRSGEGSLFFGGLRGESLYEAKVRGGDVVGLHQHFREEFGRIRAVIMGPDDWLYLTTSNTDGRGSIRPRDDKIIRVNPRLLTQTKAAPAFPAN